ncbi:MAG: CPBP family intramembrane metalloprotease [Chloroflexota bacterium]|nr:CPBP family intramembrane metalloprotease [Chloroflexota bacterium]
MDNTPGPGAAPFQQPQGGGQGQYPPVPPPGGQVPPAPPHDAYGQPYAQSPAPAPQAAPVSNKPMLITSGLALAGITLIGLGFVVGGEAAKFMTVGIQFLPLAVLAALAFAGLRNSVAATFTYVWLAILMLGVLLIIASYTVMGAITNINVFYQWLANPRDVPITQVFREDAGSIILLSLVLMMLVTLISLAMLLRPLRVLVSRVIPIDPDNFVHKIALCFLTLITLGSFLPLIALGGQPPLLLLINAPTPEGSLGQSMDISVRPIDLIYQFVWTIPATFVAAGWPIARNFRAMLKRLDFVRPTTLQVVGATVGGVVLAAAAAFALDPGINQLWRSMGWGTTDVEAFSRLMSQLITPVGAVLIGVTAGVGEELAVRGLLQPRIGLIASNLVFTSLHAFQYGVDALLSVFIIGLILGIIRMRTNTTTSAIVHGVYDFVLVMASTSYFVGQ